MENQAWRGFKGTHWTDDVNVRDFIQNNYTVYTGDESFLEGPTEATDKLWGKLQELQKEERARGGVLECETEVVTGLTAYGPGYIDPEMKGLEKVVGLQTDKPLKRAFMPYGGIKMAMQAAKTYGYEVNPKYNKIFTEYHKTHNQAVFDAYTPEMKTARHTHIVTGLPDTYGRGRIVGDYRRVALYGVDFLNVEIGGPAAEGIIHSTESFGAVDGPGIRFLIFLQGCRMRCRYCHNPDTWSMTGGERKTVGQLLNKAERYRTYWRENGGITVSGGEAMLQPEFVTALFEEAHRRGIHTALDTAGEPFRRSEPAFSIFRRLVAATDLVLLDIKHIDPEAHKNLTGHDNRNILDFARYLAEQKVPVWIRYVLVPGINDDTETLRATRAFLDTLTNVEQVDILPYHTLGIYKWEELGYTYTLGDVPPPDEETINRAREILCRRIRSGRREDSLQ